MLSEFRKAPEDKFDYFLQNQRYNYKYVYPAFSNLSKKIKLYYVWSKAVPVVRKGLHQSCKKLKQLQHHTGTSVIQKLFVSLQKNDILSQVKTALTKSVIIFWMSTQKHSLNSGKINFSSAGTITSGTKK